jgi:hypothetical protein
MSIQELSDCIHMVDEIPTLKPQCGDTVAPGVHRLTVPVRSRVPTFVHTGQYSTQLVTPAGANVVVLADGVIASHTLVERHTRFNSWMPNVLLPITTQSPYRRSDGFMINRDYTVGAQLDICVIQFHNLNGWVNVG